jgi:hypothetical protein
MRLFDVLSIQPTSRHLLSKCHTPGAV